MLLGLPRVSLHTSAALQVRRAKEDLRIELGPGNYYSLRSVSQDEIAPENLKCFHVTHTARCLFSMNTLSSKYKTITHGSDTFPRAKRPCFSIFLPCSPWVLSFLLFHLWISHTAIRTELKGDILTFLFVKIRSGKGQWLGSFDPWKREPGKPHGITSALETSISPKSYILHTCRELRLSLIHTNMKWLGSRLLLRGWVLDCSHLTIKPPLLHRGRRKEWVYVLVFYDYLITEGVFPLSTSYILCSSLGIKCQSLYMT